MTVAGSYRSSCTTAVLELLERLGHDLPGWHDTDGLAGSLVFTRDEVANALAGLHGLGLIEHEYAEVFDDVTGEHWSQHYWRAVQPRQQTLF